MEDTISRIITELEGFNSFSDSTISLTQNPQPFSQSALFDLQTLLDNTPSDNESESMAVLYEELSSRSLSPSSLVRHIAFAMDMGSTHLSLLASKCYLLLLLSPNAPVLTLFTPVEFLSLLRSIRRSLKYQPPPNQQDPNVSSQESLVAPRQNRKGGAKAKALKAYANSSCNDDNQSEENGFEAKLLYSVLERLELVTVLIHVDRFPDSLKSLVQTMADIPVMASGGCIDSNFYTKFTKLCMRVLTEVLKPENGDQADNAAEVLKSISPLILRFKSQARTFALEFVTSRMSTLAKKSDGVKRAFVNLPRYLVQKAPEKSEGRTLAVDSIMEIVKVMEFSDQIGFVEYVVKMTEGKTNLRLMGVDLIPLLIMLFRDPLDMNSESEVKDLWGSKCLGALIRRCSDVGGGIRARALLNLANLMVFLSGDMKNKALLKEIMGCSKTFRKVENENIHDLLRKRCMDEKAAVRKAALLLLTKLTVLSDGAFDGMLLKTMGVACSDPLVTIRKAAISALSEVYRNFSDENVANEWLHSVPRLIADNESSIRDECESLFLELVLERVCRAGSVCLNYDCSKIYDPTNKSQTLEEHVKMQFPEGVLEILKEICNGEVMPWVKKICLSLGKKKKLKNKIATSLKNIITTSESLWLIYSKPIEKWTAPKGAWFLLSEVSAFLAKAIKWEFLDHHWKLLDKHERESESPLSKRVSLNGEEDLESISISWAEDRVFLLQTISNVSVELPDESAADLAHSLLKRIEDFNMHSTEVNAHVKTLRTLCKRKALNLDETDRLVLVWVNQLLSKASQVLEKYISEYSEPKKDGFFFTPPTRKGMRSAAKLSRAVTAIYTIGSLVLVCPSADLASIIPLLHTIITCRNSDQKLNKLPAPVASLKGPPPSLYIQAWVTMGKICLANEKLAKSYIPLFVQELGKSEYAALRNNLIMTMTDFCVRYTSLVDCYITKITKCLCDPCELVRRQTFILLSRLLQRDYVKWRGVLFLRFLLSLVDESEKIRQLADFLFGNILKVKAPLLAYNSFVEAIFALNDCHAHSGHGGSRISQAESRLFSIRGNDEKSRCKRMHIYVSLLKQMAPEHLLATFAKLCAEILAAASDGMLDIEDNTGQNVLQDAFEVLACKEIRIHRGSSSESADNDEEGGESGAGSSAATARGRNITLAVRKGLIQNAIPIFIELKRLLENKNSPLIGSLMECLRILLKDYKTEISELLIADKQLEKELVYDMQKYESDKAKSMAAEAVEKKKSTDFVSPGNSRFGPSRRMVSAMADAEAKAVAMSVIKEVRMGKMTPPLGCLSVPKLKSDSGGGRRRGRRAGGPGLDVIESLRKRQSFDYEDDN